MPYCISVFAGKICTRKAQQAYMQINQAVDTLITKLHNLHGDSAIWLGGVIGGSWAFFDNIRIVEWFDFTLHAVVGGLISYTIKRIGDFFYKKKATAHNTDHDSKNELHENE